MRYWAPIGACVCAFALLSLAVLPPPAEPREKGVRAPGAPAWTHICLGMVDDPDWCAGQR